MIDKLETLFHFITNELYRRWPQKPPSPLRLHSSRIVSHRGEHDNQNRFENTIAAFDAAVDADVWGLELDIRWTKDMIPVVFHDANTRRLYHKDVAIGSVTLDELQKNFPLIPTLKEVVHRYGGRRHLMIEIKAEPCTVAFAQAKRMKNLLACLTPGKDFHLMSLHPALFDVFDFLPSRAFIPIARIRVDRFSRLAVKHRWGGIAGHFLMLSNGLRDRHHHLGQGLGSGFADSKNCLFREVNRNVDWIFSNRAVRMQSLCSTFHRRNRV